MFPQQSVVERTDGPKHISFALSWQKANPVSEPHQRFRNPNYSGLQLSDFLFVLLDRAILTSRLQASRPTVHCYPGHECKRKEVSYRSSAFQSITDVGLFFLPTCLHFWWVMSRWLSKAEGILLASAAKHRRSSQVCWNSQTTQTAADIAGFQSRFGDISTACFG